MCLASCEWELGKVEQGGVCGLHLGAVGEADGIPWSVGCMSVQWLSSCRKWPVQPESAMLGLVVEAVELGVVMMEVGSIILLI